MERTFELNENDIINIIAEKFNVSADHVKLHIKIFTEGYGCIEHRKLHLRATIKEEV